MKDSFANKTKYPCIGKVDISIKIIEFEKEDKPKSKLNEKQNEKDLDIFLNKKNVKEKEFKFKNTVKKNSKKNNLDKSSEKDFEKDDKLQNQLIGDKIEPHLENKSSSENSIEKEIKIENITLNNNKFESVNNIKEYQNLLKNKEENNNVPRLLTNIKNIYYKLIYYNNCITNKAENLSNRIYEEKFFNYIDISPDGNCLYMYLLIKIYFINIVQ